MNARTGRIPDSREDISRVRSCVLRDSMKPRSSRKKQQSGRHGFSPLALKQPMQTAHERPHHDGNHENQQHIQAGDDVAGSFTVLVGATALWAVPPTARGQIFVANSGTIGEYTSSGATVNAALITGVVGSGIAVSGTNLFVGNQNSGTIGEYTTSGATVNAALVSGLPNPIGIVVSGGNLFVTNSNSGTIGEYTTSGATVNASLITGLHDPQGLAVSEGDIFCREQWQLHDWRIHHLGGDGKRLSDHGVEKPPDWHRGVWGNCLSRPATATRLANTPPRGRR